ncbi:hypothetical protein E2C01_007314 [Portunus trituberculatus]|uniref:Uncharacterized protein n=1 Tax=Portunus trituberculatus TaxID=210409 RepID=A0A5B7D239_PORTR|nr:hypothetical protein [Portunus trituberculatus]
MVSVISFSTMTRFHIHSECKPRHPCKDLGGKCRRRKAGCGAGNFIYESTHNVKYCNKRSCVCCVPVVRCKANNKCSRQNGKCIWEGERCAGKVKKGKAFCGGKDCVCCIPKKPQPISCLTKYACHDLKGTCINLWKETCDTKILTGNQFCKGKDCGCCLSTMPVTTDKLLEGVN